LSISKPELRIARRGFAARCAESLWLSVAIPFELAATPRWSGKAFAF
jgi:hypothetical protein